jgi:glutamate-1-semialdehyde 2,1-aminomutase
LIFDEVFVGFRLAPGGAQEYFGVRADLSPTAKHSAAACRSASSAGANT